ncbi:hypothetical protein TNCT_736441 [Trichonephila clavata]|uniref:Uncharacterized protein n=1 Tax=Trichonephila clavata TaxID=2740835 RepID=A0A8X6I3Z7_TRICU|nr:hypothetical protein TNCT_736441 [Trichonephila clavata]
MEPNNNSPSGEHHVNISDSARFFIKTKDTFTNVSPFLIEKAISGTIGTVKTIRKICAGDLFLEVSSSNQATKLAKLQKLAHLDVTVSPHGSLNFFRGGNISSGFFECILRRDIGEFAGPESMLSPAYYYM